MLSEDRKGEGLALAMSIADNMTLAKLPAFVDRPWQLRMAEPRVAELSARCASAFQRVSQLSGGNQHKVALGGLLVEDGEILLLRPAGSTSPPSARSTSSYGRSRRAGNPCSSRRTISTSSFSSDRVCVMRRGVLGEARPAKEWTPATLLAEASAQGETLRPSLEAAQARDEQAR